MFCPDPYNGIKEIRASMKTFAGLIKVRIVYKLCKNIGAFCEPNRFFDQSADYF